jgi:hypothetical protein
MLLPPHALAALLSLAPVALMVLLGLATAGLAATIDPVLEFRSGSYALT